MIGERPNKKIIESLDLTRKVNNLRLWHVIVYCKSIFLIENPVFNGFLKIVGVQNQLPITFCLDLMCNKTLKARNSYPTYTNF